MSTRYEPGSAHIERYRGDSHSEVFTVRDSDGAAVDITGATVRFTVKEHLHQDQAAAVLAKSAADVDEVEITDPTQGEFTVKFTAAEMQALTPNRYVYDAEVTLSGGAVHTVACDVFDVLSDVSTP